MLKFVLIYLFLSLSINSLFADNDTLDNKYLKIIDYVKKDKEIKTLIKKTYSRKATKFRVSKHLISGIHWYLFEKQILKNDSLNFYGLKIDSIVNNSEQIPSKKSIPQLNQLSVDPNSSYALFFSEPYKNFIEVSLKKIGQENDTFEIQYGHTPSYGGKGWVILLFYFDDEVNIKHVFIAHPIID